MSNYQWLTYLQARQQLAAKLSDTGNVLWTDAENGLYIQEALRVWNVLTFTWKKKFVLAVPQVSNNDTILWYSLGNLSGSPRLRTVTDTQIYTLMQYHLMEPPTGGGTWTGTSQFSLSDLQIALQRTRDEMLQLTCCNVVQIGIPLTPNIRSVDLADNVLDVLRVRYLPLNPANNQHLPAITLFRADDLVFETFEPDYMTDTTTPMSSYNIASGPPLVLFTDTAPTLPGGYDVLVLQAGVAFSPPTPSLMSMPDDLTPIAKWGAMASLLGRESEATDWPRQQWCQKRYQDGLKIAASTPWIMFGDFSGSPGDVVSAAEMDIHAPEWDSSAADGVSIVICGTDTFTVVPSTTQAQSVNITMLANAPLPSADADFVQVSRDSWDAVLDYAQFLAMWKQGGAEFTAAQELEKKFVLAAATENSRLRSLGVFTDILVSEGQREENQLERFQNNGTA